MTECEAIKILLNSRNSFDSLEPCLAVEEVDKCAKKGSVRAIHFINRFINDVFRRASCGNHDAELLLANMYEFGDILDKNLKKAEEYYKKAILSGKAQAYCLCGNYYHFTKEDDDTALQMYENALRLGELEAYVSIGSIFEGRFRKTKEPKYFDLAEKYYRRGCELGDASCAYCLEKLYLRYGDQVTDRQI